MDAQIADLRLAFNREYSQNVMDSVYDSRDVDRLMTCDEYAEAFIRHQKGVISEAANMCHSALKWRKDFGLNNLTDADFPEDLLLKGAMYFHNHDKEEHPIMYFRIKEHKKNALTLPIIQKYMVYLLDREDRRVEGRQVVVLFDMTGAGVTNLDLELIKFLITCFEEYFPDHLAYLMVFDMPWILNAAWKIIRAWLSEDAKQKVIFVRGKEIFEYIDKDNILVHMGGSDDYVFKYEPLTNGVIEEVKNKTTKTTIKPTENPGKIMNTSKNAKKELSRNAKRADDVKNPKKEKVEEQPKNRNNSSDASHMAGGDGENERKHVTFSRDDPTVYSSMLQDESTEADSPISDGSPAKSPEFAMKIPEGRKVPSPDADDDAFVGTLLTIKPGRELSFKPHAASSNPNETIFQAVLQLSNPTSPLRTAYKVKTTSPEKYKVRPSLGMIKPGQSAEITVYLTAESHDVSLDKFLVMAMEVEDGFISSGELAELWRTVNKTKVSEHRLRCSLEAPPRQVKEPDATSVTKAKLDEMEKHLLALSSKMDSVLSVNKSLQQEVGWMRRTQKGLVLLVICFSLLIVITTYYRFASIEQIVEGSRSAFNSCPSKFCHP